MPLARRRRAPAVIPGHRPTSQDYMYAGQPLRCIDAEAHGYLRAEARGAVPLPSFACAILGRRAYEAMARRTSGQEAPYEPSHGLHQKGTGERAGFAQAARPADWHRARWKSGAAVRPTMIAATAADDSHVHKLAHFAARFGIAACRAPHHAGLAIATMIFGAYARHTKLGVGDASPPFPAAAT